MIEIITYYVKIYINNLYIKRKRYDRERELKNNQFYCNFFMIASLVCSF